MANINNVIKYITQWLTSEITKEKLAELLEVNYYDLDRMLPSIQFDELLDDYFKVLSLEESIDFHIPSKFISFDKFAKIRLKDKVNPPKCPKYKLDINHVKKMWQSGESMMQDNKEAKSNG